jgi:hypothetical protein
MNKKTNTREISTTIKMGSKLKSFYFSPKKTEILNIYFRGPTYFFQIK